MNLHTLLLQEDGGGEGGGNLLIMYGLIAIVFVLFIIRPQMKRNKEARVFRESLEVGSKVVTAGGIHGKILEVDETSVVLSSEGTKLRVEKSSISSSPSDQLSSQKK